MLHHTQMGQGPHLVILHGLFGSSDNWRSIQTQLSTDFCVTAIDLPNHGQSPRFDAFDYPFMAQQLQQTLTELGIHTCILMGHSMGGKVAMQFAHQWPERLSKLVVVDIAPKSYPPHHQDILNAIAGLDLSQLKDRKQADLYLAENGIETFGTRQFILKNLYKTQSGQFDWRFHFEGIRQHYQHIAKGPELDHPVQLPTLFVKGGDSNYIQADDQPLIQQWFPKARARIISGAGHWPHAEKANLFLKSLDSFLRAE